MQGRRRGGAVKGGPDGFAIERDECPLGELGDGLYPGQKALLKTFGIEARKDPAKGSILVGDGIASSIYHAGQVTVCLLYTSPSPRDRQKSRMPSSA